MPVLNAEALNADPQGLEFLRDVLGTRAETSSPERRFPLEAWTPKVSMAETIVLSPEIEPRLVEAAL